MNTQSRALFAFDVKLSAVCRVEADSEQAARTLMDEVLDCIDLSWSAGPVRLTEASLATEPEDCHLFWAGRVTPSEPGSVSTGRLTEER